MKNKKRIIEIGILGIIVLLLGVYFNYANHKETKLLPQFKIKETDFRQFAMFIESNGDYTPYEEKKFPTGYLLNMDKSFCADNNGLKIENALSSDVNGVTVKSNKTAFCTLYFDKANAVILTYDNAKSKTQCTEVQCALDELYGLFR